MFIRKKKNISGTVSIQIINKSSGKYKLVETIGCSSCEKEIEFLLEKANIRLKQLQPNLFDCVDSLENKHRFIKIKNDDISVVGASLIFGEILEYIGCNKILNNLKDKELFNNLVITRLVNPGSKLNLVDYMTKYQHKTISIDKIYRFLDNIHYKLKDELEQCIFDYSQTVLGEITVSFYDVTTLYFEASSEDDLRKVGFSKDGKFTKPQIVLGLLTSLDGYPLAYEIYQGNTYEGKTFIPILTKFQKRFNIKKPIVVADSGLLSKKNIALLEEHDYKYILGARIKSVTNKIKEKIVNLNLNEAKDISTIILSKQQKLIISYSKKELKKIIILEKKACRN